jgi:hypothetical protein
VAKKTTVKHAVKKAIKVSKAVVAKTSAKAKKTVQKLVKKATSKKKNVEQILVDKNGDQVKGGKKKKGDGKLRGKGNDKLVPRPNVTVFDDNPQFASRQPHPFVSVADQVSVRSLNANVPTRRRAWHTVPFNWATCKC